MYYTVEESGDNIGDHDNHLMAADVDDRPCNEIRPSLPISILCKTDKNVSKLVRKLFPAHNYPVVTF